MRKNLSSNSNAFKMKIFPERERKKEREMIVFLWPIRHTINYLNPSTNFSIGKAGAVVSVFASLWRRFRFEARTKNRPGNLLLKI